MHETPGLPMSMHRSRIAVVACALAGTALSADAQNGSSRSGGAQQSSAASLAISAPKPSGTITIDGRIDEPSWATAGIANAFTQQSPEPGRPATQPTEARVLVDGDAVYVALRLDDAAPDSIVATLARRDYDGYSDWAHVYLDSFHDRRTAFHFAVNPAGVKRDGMITGDSPWSEDFGWDAVWDVATRRDASGWTAELRIPLSQLRFASVKSTEGAVWGIEFGRDIARRAERSYWAPIPPSTGTFVSNFGTLSGVPVHEAKRRLEISPYVVARSRQSSDADANPLRRSAEQTATVGADFKIGLTSDLTLTGTINPDFGQVEADPSQVNLTGAELLFSERRSFFIEGLDLFQHNLSWADWIFGPEELFYTRRIGRAPQLDFPDGARHTTAPDLTRIIGAGKLSGQSGAWRLGLLSATTAEERGRYSHATGVRQHIVEPLTHYGVARVGRDFDRGEGQLSLIGTATNRRLGPSSIDVLHASAYAGGVEGRRRFGGHYSAAGYLFGSVVNGSPAAIARTQTSFNHLFQRDPEALGLDSSLTSLSGLAGELRVTKHSGGRFRFGLTAHAATRGFEVNDVGFMTRSNFANTTGWVGRVRNDPTTHTRSWHSFVNWWSLWGLHGPERMIGANWWNRLQLHNQWEIVGATEYYHTGVSVSALRGGPAIRTPARWIGSYNVTTDPRPRLSWVVSLGASPRSEDGSWHASVGPGLRLRPADRAELQLQPSIEWRRTGAQFVDDVSTDAGARYLVGDLRQRTASVTARASVAFTPTLTLQGYAQPFVSAGRYERVGEVAQPLAGRHGDRVRFFDEAEIDRGGDGTEITYRTSGGRVTIDNPDFSITSMNANLVLRWEYRAGSTLYAVWSHGRDDDAHHGRASIGRLTGDLWRAPATNVFLVKVAHYLGR